MRLRYSTIGFLAAFMVVFAVLGATYKRISAYSSDIVVNYIWYALLGIFVLFGIVVLSLFFNSIKERVKRNRKAKPEIVNSLEYGQIMRQTKRIGSELKQLRLQ